MTEIFDSGRSDFRHRILTVQIKAVELTSVDHRADNVLILTHQKLPVEEHRKIT